MAEKVKRKCVVDIIYYRIKNCLNRIFENKPIEFDKWLCEKITGYQEVNGIKIHTNPTIVPGFLI